MQQIILEYRAREDQRKREEWKVFYMQQLATWKHRALTAVGVSTVVGMAVGGATAVMAGSAFGFAKGALAAATRGRDATQATIQDQKAAHEQLALEDQRPQVTTFVKKGGGRSLSVGTLPALTAKQAAERGHCLACHTPNPCHLAHLGYGDCAGLPGSSYFKKPLKDAAPSSGDPETAARVNP